MYIITDTQSNRVMIAGELVEYWPNGYPVIEDFTTTKYAFPPEFTAMHIVDSIPEDFMPDAYSYTEEEGFYKTPGWEQASKYGVPVEVLEQIKDEAIFEVEQEVIHGTDE